MWYHLVLAVIIGWNVFVSVLAFAYLNLLFGMLLSLYRTIASFSLRKRRHRLELWLYDFWVAKVSQDMFEVLFADIILQYSFDSSVSV